MPNHLVESIKNKTDRLEINLSERGRNADFRYAKFVVKQTDKSPPTRTRLDETISIMNQSS